MMSSFVIHLFSRSLGIQFVFCVRNELKINDEKYIYVITTRKRPGFRQCVCLILNRGGAKLPSFMSIYQNGELNFILYVWIFDFNVVL